LRYVKPGGYFGEEVLTGRRRRYFAEAVTNSSVESVAVEKLSRQALLELATFLASSLDQMNRALLRLAGKPLRARIAAELLELSDSALAGRTDTGESVVYMTHDDLAAAVGSVRETVTKVIGDMARSGALRAGYGKIVVIDQAQLAELAGD
jgi:CRP-like cAMP-binding protein